jgi:hypothetical protein
MFDISLEKFNGIVPRISAKLLPKEAAQTAENCRLLSGRLEPINDVGNSVGSGSGDIFKWYRNDSSEWLSGYSDYVKGPINDDSYDRVYLLADGTLKMNAWSGSKITRTVGLSAPNDSHIPSISESVPNQYIFDPTSSGNNVRLTVKTTASAVAGTTHSGSITDSTSATLQEWSHLPSGRMRMKFKLESQVKQIALSFGAPYSTYTGRINDDFLLTLVADKNADTDTNLPETIGTNIISESKDLKDASGEKYGEMVIESVKIINRKVYWRDSTGSYNFFTHDSPITGCGISWSPYEVEIIANMNYDRYAGSSSAGATQWCYYLQTYVDDLGEESPPSNVSNMINFQAGKQIALSLGADPGGNISKRRLYRSAAGSSEDAFFFLAEVDAGTTTYTDTKADAELGEALPVFENPPSSMSGLVSHPNGFLIGFKDHNVYFSEPWVPYSWPSDYTLTTEYSIVGIAVSGGDIVVLTTGTPVVIRGSHPSNLVSDSMAFNQACVSKDGICKLGNSVVYPSPDGLCAIQHGSGKVLTDSFFTRQEWQDLTPSSIIAAVQDRSYLMWSTGGNYILDFGEGLSTITTHDIDAAALHTDLVDDTLYLRTAGNSIVPWYGGSAKTLTWKGRLEHSTKNVRPTCCRVVADSYPVTLKIYSDGTLRSTISVTSDAAQRIERIQPTREWEIEVSGAMAIDAVYVASSMRRLR